MPTWLATILLPFGISIIENVAVPFLKVEFPKEAQLIDAVVQFLNDYFKIGQAPSTQLSAAAEHYDAVNKLVK